MGRLGTPSFVHLLPALMKNAYAFVDGGYLRARLCLPDGRPFDPATYLRRLCSQVLWGSVGKRVYGNEMTLTSIQRLYYYDAAPEHVGQPDSMTDADALLESFWEQLEQFDDVQLRFGDVRGQGKRKRRQKGVDVLLAVDAMAGACDRQFDVAVLLAGDADFVPVVNEIRRRGVLTLLVSKTDNTSSELLKACDRWLELPDRSTGAPA